MSLFERDRRRVEGSRSGSIYQRVALHTNLAVYDYLKGRVAIRVPEAAAACGTTKPTVARALEDLVRLGIAEEVTAKARNRVYVYKEYVQILNRDAEPRGASVASSTEGTTRKTRRPRTGKRTTR
jgi:predicted transcriptional regulator